MATNKNSRGPKGKGTAKPKGNKRTPREVGMRGIAKTLRTGMSALMDRTINAVFTLMTDAYYSMLNLERTRAKTAGTDFDEAGFWTDRDRAESIIKTASTIEVLKTDGTPELTKDGARKTKRDRFRALLADFAGILISLGIRNLDLAKLVAVRYGLTEDNIAKLIPVLRIKAESYRADVYPFIRTLVRVGLCEKSNQGTLYNAAGTDFANAKTAHESLINVTGLARADVLTSDGLTIVQAKIAAWSQLARAASLAKSAQPAKLTWTDVNAFIVAESAKLQKVA